MKNGVLSLFWGAVVKELSKSMNFKIEVTSIMSEYGSWNEEEKIWEGVIGELVSNKSDMGVAEFSMTSHRLDAVDFSLPLIMSHKRIYFKKPDSSSVHWSAYLKVFFFNSILHLVVFNAYNYEIIRPRVFTPFLFYIEGCVNQFSMS